MASVSVSHVIMFIASLIIAASVAGTLVAGVDRVSTSVDDRSMHLTDRIDTDIEIISDPGSDAIYDDDASTVTVLVKNTGQSTIAASPDAVDVLLNGEYIADHDLEPITGDGWARGDVVRIQFDESLGSGDHRVAVTVNGNQATVQFRVE